MSSVSSTFTIDPNFSLNLDITKKSFSASRGEEISDTEMNGSQKSTSSSSSSSSSSRISRESNPSGSISVSIASNSLTPASNKKRKSICHDVWDSLTLSSQANPKRTASLALFSSDALKQRALVKLSHTKSSVSKTLNKFVWRMGFEVASIQDKRDKALNKDVIILIASYLGRPFDIARVSRSWNEAIQEYYSQLLIEYQAHPLVSRFLPQAGNPRSLVLGTYEQITHRYNPGVVRLPLLVQAVKDSDLIEFYRRLPNTLSKPDIEPGLPSQQAASIREWLKRPENQNIFQQITSLDFSYSNLRTIPEEIQYFPNLISLQLFNNEINEVSNISTLTKLMNLNLENNQLGDITALGTHAKLKVLYLRGNQISDVSVLSKLPDLETVDLAYNQINDVTSLRQLEKLKFIALSFNRIQVSEKKLRAMLHVTIRESVNIGMMPPPS